MYSGEMASTGNLLSFVFCHFYIKQCETVRWHLLENRFLVIFVFDLTMQNCEIASTSAMLFLINFLYLTM